MGKQKEIETMKEIPNFPNYCVTKGGRVWSKPRRGSSKNGKWLKQIIDSSGYLHINLYNNRGRRRYPIHHVVLNVFVGLCPIGMECRHLDGNKKNNKLNNLNWGTHSENAKDMVKHNKLIGERKCNHKLAVPDVRMIVYMYRTGLFFMQEIADIYDISKQLVWQIIHRKAWKHVWAEKKEIKI
jgi:hypothetical protein